MVLNEEQWIKELREKRIAYGISQGRLAVASGITREYLNKIESGKMNSAAGIYGILVLDDKNNYESQWSDRLVLVDIYCRIAIWNT